MTCIVGLKHGGKVYIGGDSIGFCPSTYAKTVRADEKVFHNGEFIFGFTTSFRMGQILRYSFTPPPRLETTASDMEYLVTTFIPAVIQAFETHGFSTSDNGAKTGGQFLLGYRGELYCIFSDYQVSRPVIPYDAVGCGEDLAKGALHVLLSLPNGLTGEEIVGAAIKAAAEHSAGVSDPVKIVQI